MAAPIPNTPYVIVSAGDSAYRLRVNGGNYIDCMIFEGPADRWRVEPIVGAPGTFAVVNESTHLYVSAAPNDGRVSVTGDHINNAVHFSLVGRPTGTIIKSADPANDRVWTVGNDSMIYMRAPNPASSQVFKFVQA